MWIIPFLIIFPEIFLFLFLALKVLEWGKKG